MNLELIQNLARKNLTENSSARLNLSESIAIRDKVDCTEQDWRMSAVKALRSIAYSVGILHADYKRAFKASGIPGEVRLVSGIDAFKNQT